MLDRHVARRQEPHDVDEQPAGNDDGALFLDLGVERDTRSEISMSVAASASRPASARSMIPVRMLTLVRVETARPTTPSLPASSSRGQVIFIRVATTVSMDVILF